MQQLFFLVGINFKRSKMQEKLVFIIVCSNLILGNEHSCEPIH